MLLLMSGDFDNTEPSRSVLARRRHWAAFFFALDLFSLAFCLLAFAAACEALRAIARLFSGVMVFSRALPPRRPSSARYFEISDLFMREL